MVLNSITGSMSNHSAECDLYDITCVQRHKGLLDSKAQRRPAHKMYNACPYPSGPVDHQHLSVHLRLWSRCTAASFSSDTAVNRHTEAMRSSCCFCRSSCIISR
jgi:hypothetical protein